MSTRIANDILKLAKGLLGKINQKDYKFYVIVGDKIDSGWEYKEDAKDRLDEVSSGKVLTKSGAKRKGIDPDDDASWMGGKTAQETEVDSIGDTPPKDDGEHEPVASLRAAEQYQTINDAEAYQSGMAKGNTEIWYMKDAFFRDGLMGYDWLEEEGLLPDPRRLSKTHVLLGKIKERNDSKVYSLMQGERWSPQGEANNIIGRSGTGHTSMSVGDIMVLGSKVVIVDKHGFQGIK